MKVLGISGSPIYDSNADRALKAALAATGLETEFVKLVGYKITPCRACIGCVDTNTCVNTNDDGIFLAKKVLGNVPCIKCGYGDDCKTSGVKMIFGSGATVQSVGVNKFEDQRDALDAARALGKRIADALNNVI